jgi:hypothetical protein
MSDDRPPLDVPPLVAWMSRHGLKVIGVLVLIEVVFHGWAVMQGGEGH